MSYHKENYQTLFINNAGVVTTSKGQLFAIPPRDQFSALNEFPFIESIFPSLLCQSPGQLFEFRKVKTIHKFLPGIYDYTFIRLHAYSTCQPVLVWMILDKTKEYEFLLQEQQLRQEVIIENNSYKS